MNANLKANIVQKLENMPDESGRQLLDYMEFLESKFNRSKRERSTLERFAENVEGTLRSNVIGEAAIRGTGGLIDAASSVARGVAAAGQAVLDELQQVVGDGAEKAPKNAGTTDGAETDDSTGDSSTDDEPEDAGAPQASDENASEGEAGGEKTSA